MNGVNVPEHKIVVDNEEFFKNVIRLLYENHTVEIPVKGFSMLPFIRGEKDRVVLEGIRSGVPVSGKSRPLSRGDIVLFRYEGRFILHRILKVQEPVDGKSFKIAVIRGDGVCRHKERAAFDKIYGRVTEIERDADGKASVVDPSSRSQRTLWNLWELVVPFRKILLFVYRRLPSNSWLRKQYENINI